MFGGQVSMIRRSLVPPSSGFSDWDICCLGLCLWNSIVWQTRELRWVFALTAGQPRKLFRPPELSSLVQRCQVVLNDISTQHSVGLYWVPGHAGVWKNEIADKLARGGSVEKFVGLEPFLGVSRQNIWRTIRYWLDNQHLEMWWALGSTQRQARVLVSRPTLSAKTRLLSLNRTQSRAMIGLSTCSSIYNLRTRHAVVTGTQLWTYYWKFGSHKRQRISYSMRAILLCYNT
jgi:hypothetical protein